ncbi:MFS transporter [Actinomadura sp. NPDC023710]|uniref:MFS transporter n=1 Tax=Actinomadura sp. NPDC023710 TaxID=3158219 RepID=UPI00340ABBB8
MSEDTLQTTGAAVHRWRWAGLAALLTAEAMNLLDTTIVQVAGPAVHTDLGGRVAAIQWFTAAYTLVFALLLIGGGRLGDRHGRRRIFRLGVAGFGLASLACALAPSAGVLIGLRAVQGAFAAAVIPQTFGLIRAMFSGSELPKALGCIGPVMGLAAVCGPVLGGVLTQAASWRWVFLVNVPLTLAVLAVAPLLPEDRAPSRPRLDPLGTALALTGSGLVVYPLVQGTWDASLIAAGLVVLALFGLHQRRSARAGRRPLVEPSLFTGRGFPAALATSVLFFAAMNGLMLAVVLYVQLGLGRDTITSALTLLPWSAAMGAASWITGAHLVPRFGARVMHAGLAVMLAGVLAAIWAFHAHDGYPPPLPAALALAGLGVGLFTTPFFTTALKPVKAHETGSAAGLLNAVQQFGGTLGVAVIGSVYQNVARHAAPAAAVQHAFWPAAVLLAGAALAAVPLRAGLER